MAKRGRIDIRIRPDVKEDWQRAAEQQGIGVTELIHRQMAVYTRPSTTVVPSTLRQKEKVR
jgi:hypothetical protein